MSNWIKFTTIAAIIGAFSLLIVILNDIGSTYTKLGTVTTQLNQVNKELTQIKQDFSDYKVDVKKVNEIDTKFTKELADAKAENNKLYNNVISGIGRLQLNISKTTKTTATSVDDAKACELSGEARHNYYLLRDDIIVKDKTILGLQEYIYKICL